VYRLFFIFLKNFSKNREKNGEFEVPLSVKVLEGYFNPDRKGGFI